MWENKINGIKVIPRMKSLQGIARNPCKGVGGTSIQLTRSLEEETEVLNRPSTLKA